MLRARQGGFLDCGTDLEMGQENSLRRYFLIGVDCSTRPPPDQDCTPNGWHIRAKAVPRGNAAKPGRDRLLKKSCELVETAHIYQKLDVGSVMEGGARIDILHRIFFRDRSLAALGGIPGVNNERPIPP